MHSQQPVHELGEASIGALHINNRTDHSTGRARGLAGQLCIGMRGLTVQGWAVFLTALGFVWWQDVEELRAQPSLREASLKADA